MMKAVLKTMQDGSEVYLTSLHISDEASVRRALKKYTSFKNEYGALNSLWQGWESPARARNGYGPQIITVFHKLFRHYKAFPGKRNV